MEGNFVQAVEKRSMTSNATLTILSGRWSYGSAVLACLGTQCRERVARGIGSAQHDTHTLQVAVDYRRSVKSRVTGYSLLSRHCDRLSAFHSNLRLTTKSR